MTQMGQDRRQALAGRAYCSECHSTMLRMGPDYICPSRVDPTAESCTNNSVNASRLLRLVATHIVGTVMTKPTIDRLAQRIQEDAQETSRRFQKQLDQTEDSLNELTLQDLNRLGLNLYFIEEEAEKNSRNNRNQQMDPNDISNKRTALAYEARNARRELDAQAFISDEARVRANAKNVDTFLDDAPPEVTNEFIENFVKSVGVGTRSIDLNYKFPIPSPDFPEGKLTYVIPRSGSDLTGVIDAGPDEPPQTPVTPYQQGKRMGTFRTTITVGNPDGEESEQIAALVDTGAAHSMFPADLLRRLNIVPVTERRLTFANGESQMMPIGLVRIGINGESWPCPVIFGTQNEYLLGATTLEIFDLLVDPVEQQLTPREFLARPLSLIHRTTACGRSAEEARGCASESGIMVLKQKTDPRKGAPNRCYHATTPTASASPSTTTAWWPMPG